MSGGDRPRWFSPTLHTFCNSSAQQEGTEELASFFNGTSFLFPGSAWERKGRAALPRQERPQAGRACLAGRVRAEPRHEEKIQEKSALANKSLAPPGVSPSPSRSRRHPTP